MAYDPQGGKILWNRQDLQELELKKLYSRMTVIRQDYAQFPATVREEEF